MPLKAIPDGLVGFIGGPIIEISKIKHMVNGYDSMVRVHALPRMQALHGHSAKDSISCWFSYTEIQQLFADNIAIYRRLTDPTAPDSIFGLKIYYGVHSAETTPERPNSELPPERKDYRSRHNVILVVTANKNGVPYDLLSVEATEDVKIEDIYSVSTTGYYNGLDLGTLCPPQTGCLTGSLVFP